MKYALQLVLLWAATSAALLGWSEFIFVNEGPVLSILGADWWRHALALWALYLIPAAALLALWSLRWPATWGRAVVSGALVGWAIEGALVPAVYEAPPLSFLWTSVAWHAPVDVALGLWLLPLLMQRRISAFWLAPVLGITGVLMGLWALWTVGSHDDALNMTPSDYGWVMGLGTAGALAGALAWARWGPLAVMLPRSLAWTALVACGALMLLQGLVAPIWGAALALGIALTLWLSLRDENRPPNPADLSPMRGIWFTLLPLLAVVTYAIALDAIPQPDVEFIAFIAFFAGMGVAALAFLRTFTGR